MYQPDVTDAATLREYCQDLTVSKYMSDLSPSLRSQVRGQILGGDSIITLTVTFSRVMRISTGADVSYAPSIDQSAMIFGRGRGRDCGRGSDFGGGRSSFGGGHGSYDGTHIGLDKGPNNVSIAGGIIIYI